MPSRANRRPARSLTRWLGFDRNPLRRGTDRVEAVLRLVLVILLVVVIPAAAVAAGRWADRQALRQAQAERTADHQVTAVLLENAPATGAPDPYTSVQTAWVRARWQPPGQPPRTGEVMAVVGARQGSTVRTWIDRSGAVADPPMEHRVIAGYICFAVMITCVLSWLVLLAAVLLVRRVLDRRRLNAWEAEWRAGGPLWSGHRS